MYFLAPAPNGVHGVCVARCVEAVKVSQQFHFLCGFSIHIFSPFSQQIDKQIFAGKTAEKFLMHFNA